MAVPAIGAGTCDRGPVPRDADGLGEHLLDDAQAPAPASAAGTAAVPAVADADVLGVGAARTSRPGPDRHRGHPLRPVIAMPRMKYLDANRYTIITGMTVSIEPADHRS